LRLALSRGALVVVAVVIGIQASCCQSFNLSGHENLTQPGDAHLILSIAPQETWAKMSLRIEISGAMAGVLLFPRIEPKLDLAYFYLEGGNYTFDIYVVERLGSRLEDSGDLEAHEQIGFTIPSGPEPPRERKPIIDPVNLGFMLTGLFTFGLLLLIFRTTGRPVKKPPA